MDTMAEGPLESLLATASSVAVARFARDGILVQATPRFLEVTGALVGTSKLTHIVAEGQRAEMAALLSGGELPEIRRYVHFATGVQPPVSLLVAWAWHGDELLLVGEVPIADLDATQTMLVKLNARVSELARENAKKSAQLQHALADLQQAQTMLVHREKMAALGQMTAGVAHELNNPLAYVKNNLYLLGRGIEALLGFVNIIGEDLDSIEVSNPALFEALLDAVEAIDLPALSQHLPELVASTDAGIDRATGLVASLRTFSRLDEAETKTIDLNESLAAAMEFLAFQIKETDTQFDVDWGELPPVTCAPGHLNQAVFNLVTNAIQASSPGGHVVLSTRLVGHEVHIGISDDGPGVPEDIAERVFDPFFTTRPVGEGTGLGLSIANTIVAAHDGRITLQSPPDGGAIFTICIPADREARS